jgi:hypothetical protein
MHAAIEREDYATLAEAVAATQESAGARLSCPVQKTAAGCVH